MTSKDEEKDKPNISIPAVRVKQWLREWDSFPFDKTQRQAKPKPHFFSCSMPAWLLRRLSGVNRREVKGSRAAELGIQRGHDQKRSLEISRFVSAGYPWASLNTNQQERFSDLKKPGWLPTAIVANLVGRDTYRFGTKVQEKDRITIDDLGNDIVQLILPEGCDGTDWELAEEGLEPIEIIDGQHRLYAFSKDEALDGDFEFPVVLFDDLDISWQAYLFWTINIRPKRINPSLAYDLYPLMRTADWLERVDGPMAYRETRAQELTEALWSYPESPWKDRIGMLGRERGKVTQAAFVRSLTLSFVRGWEGNQSTGIGGFFGTQQSEERTDVLRWNRTQQAAYLIQLWSALQSAISMSNEEWAVDLRKKTPGGDQPAGFDPAFTGRYSILATDQGVRGFLQVCNDMSYVGRKYIPFSGWQRTTSTDETDHSEITDALDELKAHSDITDYIERLTKDISSFDWRSAVTPHLPENVESFQSRYRGGSGYRQVRLQLTRFLAKESSGDIAKSAQMVAGALGFSSE